MVQKGVSYTMEDGYPRLTDEVAEKLNDGDTDYLINTIGAGFGGSKLLLRVCSDKQKQQR